RRHTRSYGDWSSDVCSSDLGRCRCSIDRIRQYRAKLSGPLLDRIDLQIAMPAVEVARLSSLEPGEASSSVRARVLTARAIQAARSEERRVGRECRTTWGTSP